MPKQIAVICAHNDAHIPFVEKHLQAPFFRIDPQTIATGDELSFYVDGHTTRVVYRGEDITNLHGIWLRKPQPIQASDLPVPNQYKAYSRSALEILSAQLLTAFPDARWLSDRYAQDRANNKALQLALAQTCGFSVAPTLFTSSPAAAKRFMDEHGTCIVKPLATHFPIVNGHKMALMTTRIGDGFTPQLDGLQLAPSIFQKEIPVDIEVRAIVVGNQVFAATMQTVTAESSHNKHISQHIRDNRYRFDDTHANIRAVTLPKAIAKRCIRHCTLLKLPFGAIDLIRDKDGVWWFLENNPNGQWAFVEQATGLPIGKAIAAYLEA